MPFGVDLKPPALCRTRGHPHLELRISDWLWPRPDATPKPIGFSLKHARSALNMRIGSSTPAPYACPQDFTWTYLISNLMNGLCRKPSSGRGRLDSFLRW